ncbi:MAG: hypothetical protein C0391_08890 [Anaerolinea sp.]|nr:hypothetical protein [Anaerolinea sp.]
MPTYEFTCQKCCQRFSILLTYSEYDQAVIHCHHCGSEDVTRKIGRIRVMRGEGGHETTMPDPSMFGAMGQDPEAMGRMMRQMAQDTGEPMPEELNEVVSRLERGENPEQIEKSMPDLGEDSSIND